MQQQSRTVHALAQAEDPLTRHLPLVGLLIDTRAELTELVVRSGMKVLEAMLEEDRIAVCGPRYAHQAERDAGRAGTTASSVVLGGRKVRIRRPRVRAGKQELPLPTFEAMAQTDPLNRRVVEQMLLGVATRRYARSLEPLPAAIRSHGTSKSSVSRRFVARTTSQVRAWQAASLESLELVALFIDGVVFAERCLVVALGIDATGQKHPLGLWDGSTENAAVCQGLLSNLQSRGLRTDRSILVILDGSKALRSAVNQTFGPVACVQRCQVHKTRNVLDYLSDRQRPWVHAILRRAYASADAVKARRLLEDLARRLEDEFPSAAESVREGLDETLTVLRLSLSERLRRSLATTNPIESLMSRTRHVQRNVKRWRSGKMMIRWMTAAVFEAAKGFRRVKGCKDLPALVTALRQRDEQLGLTQPTTAERVA
jgi:putative transposase